MTTPPPPESTPESVTEFLGSLARMVQLRARRGLAGSAVEQPPSSLDLDPGAARQPGAFPWLGDLDSTAAPVGARAGAGPTAPASEPGPAATGSGQSRAEPPIHAEPAAAAVSAAGSGAAPAPDPEPQPTLAELLAQLDALTGLAEVKAEIHRQVALLRVESLRAKAGLKSPTITRHLVFVGNPGTGKTTVARLVGGIYRALGLLSQGQLVEVDRSELVAGYLGQTATKTADVVASAAGGVLFIDEAYSLAGDQYGEEAVDTLVKEMEDRRDDLVVIVAGYPGPMVGFIVQNPGLASRFRTTIEFADYTDEELESILVSLAAGADYDLGEGCREAFHEILQGTPRGPSFGNGRFARNTLEAAIGRHAWRLRDVAEPTLAALRTLLPEDLAAPDADPVVATADHDGAGEDVELDAPPQPAGGSAAATPTLTDRDEESTIESR